VQTYSPTKYHLIDIHKEIDLFDRKIAYCQQFEKFDAESARVSALSKLQKKRSSLVKIAITFSSQGIEYDPKFLPRSLAVDSTGQIIDAPHVSVKPVAEGIAV
jgi:hypothetical protein